MTTEIIGADQTYRGFTGGDLRECLEWVLDNGAKDQIQDFLFVYRDFGTPEQLFNMWVDFYDKCKNRTTFLEYKMQKGCKLFLKQWVELYLFKDFKKPLFVKLQKLISNFEPQDQREIHLLSIRNHHHWRDNKHHKLYGMLAKVLPISAEAGRALSLSKLRSGLLLRTPSESDLDIKKISKISIHSLTGMGKVPPPPVQLKKIMQYSARDLALQITFIDVELFKHIEVDEVLHTAWQKPDKHTRAPNVSALIKRFNEISFWVATEILELKDPKEQVRSITKYIILAKKLQMMNNFNSMAAVRAGLGHGSIQRLRKLWEIVPEKVLQQYKEVEDLLAPQHGHRAYRDYIKQTTGPAIPFLAVMQKDLTFADENPKFLPDGRINFDWIHIVGKIVRKIQSYQHDKFSAIEPNQYLLEMLLNLHYVDDDKLFKMSQDQMPSLINLVLEDIDTTPAGSHSSATPAFLADLIRPDDSDHMSTVDTAQDSSSERTDRPYSMDDEDKTELSDSDDEDDRSSPLTKQPSSSSIKDSSSTATDPRHGDDDDRAADYANLKTVTVPDSVANLYLSSERYLHKQFQRMRTEPEQGIITVMEERYLLMRATSLSKDYFATAKELFGFEDNTRHTSSMLYDLAQFIGQSDAKSMVSATGEMSTLGDHLRAAIKETNKPVELICSMLPVHSAFSGWSTWVEHTPVRDVGDLPVYIFERPNSFEAESWIRRRLLPNYRRPSQARSFTDHCVCVMCSGYVSGYLQEILQVQLLTAEVLCRAKGDECCRFIATRPDKMDDVLAKYITQNGLHDREPAMSIPTYLRPKIEKYCRKMMDKPNSPKTHSKKKSGLPKLFTNPFKKDKKNKKPTPVPTTNLTASPTQPTQTLLQVHLTLPLKAPRKKLSRSPSVTYHAVSTSKSAQFPPQSLSMSSIPTLSSSVSPSSSPTSLGGTPVDSNFFSSSPRLPSITESQPETAINTKFRFDKDVTAEIWNKAEQYFGVDGNLIKVKGSEGSVYVQSERYVLIRASSLAKDYFDVLRQFYPESQSKVAHELAANFLFDMGRCMGQTDSKEFCSLLEFTTNVFDQISALPVYLAYTGWAIGEMSSDSNISLEDKSNFNVMIQLSNCFESETWLPDTDDLSNTTTNKHQQCPVCFMSAGYISGWFERCVGVPLVTVEVSCAAIGRPSCQFLVATPDKIAHHVKTYLAAHKIEHLLPNLTMLNLHLRMDSCGF